jgi:rod shape-determining protein MreD
MTIPEKAETLARFCVPYALIFFLWIIDMVSLNIPYLQDLQPSFTLMFLFYWSIYRPTLLPSWLIFLMGVILDLVSGFPVGLNAFLFIVIQRVILDQRKIFSGQPFWTVLFAYALVATIFYMAQFIIFGVLQGQFISVETIFGITLLSVVFFPVISLMLHLTHKVLPFENNQVERKRNIKLSVRPR